MKIATIINYSTIDYPFLKPCIDQVRPFSSQVIVSFCDHFFLGEPEDFHKINQNIQDNPAARFIQFPLLPKLSKFNDAHFWHNVGRWVGAKYLNDDIDYILFLDTDEIIDTERFIDFFKSLENNPDFIRFLSYWYFRDLENQAKQWEIAGILVKKSVLKAKHYFTEKERHNFCIGNGIDNALGLDEKPLVHHYSWVRTKEEMIKKVSNWGHGPDRGNWIDLIEKEFQGPFSGKDFVHGYDYQTVKPLISLKNHTKTTSSTSPNNLTVLTRKNLKQMLKQSTLKNYLTTWFF